MPGPSNSGYGKREHPLDALAAAIAADADQRGTKLILVAAHSSGAFVADAALAALGKARPDLLARVAYFKLDGGWSGDLKAASVGKLGAIYCVAGKCGSVPSRNFGAMTRLLGLRGRPRAHGRLAPASVGTAQATGRSLAIQRHRIAGVYKSRTRFNAALHAEQNGTSSRVNITQSASAR